MSTKFLEGRDGEQSNSRLIADIMISCALLMVFIFIWVGVFKDDRENYYVRHGYGNNGGCWLNVAKK